VLRFRQPCNLRIHTLLPHQTVCRSGGSDLAIQRHTELGCRWPPTDRTCLKCALAIPVDLASPISTDNIYRRPSRYSYALCTMPRRHSMPPIPSPLRLFPSARPTTTLPTHIPLEHLPAPTPALTLVPAPDAGVVEGLKPPLVLEGVVGRVQPIVRGAVGVGGGEEGQAAVEVRVPRRGADRDRRCAGNGSARGEKGGGGLGGSGSRLRVSHLNMMCSVFREPCRDFFSPFGRKGTLGSAIAVGR
jgi:hypothetical protein